jgi:hypothetical protein
MNWPADRRNWLRMGRNLQKLSSLMTIVSPPLLFLLLLEREKENIYDSFFLTLAYINSEVFTPLTFSGCTVLGCDTVAGYLVSKQHFASILMAEVGSGVSQNTMTPSLGLNLMPEFQINII